MRFLIKHHQFKEQPYLEALLAAGHVQAKDADVCLIDLELPHEPYRPYIEYARQIGAKLVAYPHGLGLVSADHLIREPLECALSLVHGPGSKKLRELYDYPNPVEWCGYPGDRTPLEPREPNHVLFAPYHPSGHGWMSKEGKRANTEAFRTLLRGRDFLLTVRLIGSLEQNGIWEEPGVRYIWGQMDGSVDYADVAVCGGTYMAQSLCRGIPCVTYNQEREWRMEVEGSEESAMVPDWLEHEAKVRYPYDLGTWPESLNAAAKRSMYPELQDWIKEWMPPFEPERFAKLVEDACLAPSA